MKIAISQFYMKPGINFPFSHLMQRFVTQEITGAASDFSELQDKYRDTAEIGITVDADTQITENELLGPSVSKKYKSVVYTLKLPFDVIAGSHEGCRVAMRFLMTGVRAVFLKVGINPTKLDERTAFIIDHVCSDPTMLKGPWPHGPRPPGELH